MSDITNKLISFLKNNLNLPVSGCTSKSGSNPLQDKILYIKLRFKYKSEHALALNSLSFSINEFLTSSKFQDCLTIKNINYKENLYSPFPKGEITINLQITYSTYYNKKNKLSFISSL